jgi:hypothetical protein
VARSIETRVIDTIGAVDLHESTDGHLFVADAGTTEVIGSAWGPAADGTGEWFASRWLTETAPIRVRDRAAAIDYITTAPNGGTS